MNRAETAVAKFKEGYNCAQSVLFAYADRTGMDPDVALRISNGLGAGMGRKQEVCGAVSGAILVLGLLYGRGEHDGRERQEEAYAKVRELIEKFESEHGTVNCRELLGGCVLLSPEGQKRFQSEKLIERCHGFVAAAVGTIEGLSADGEL